jgi:hypothetical protein
MNAETIQAGMQFLVMVLSFALLLRARHLSAGLRLTKPAYRCLPAESAVKQPSESERIFRA